MLEAIHHQLLMMSTFDSFQPGLLIYQTHRLIPDFLAGEHFDQATDVLAQPGDWLPPLSGEAYATNVILLTPQSLVFWITNISLMTDDKKALSCNVPPSITSLL